jgi:acyl-CoA synthetase (AMP-forming)/AMP-acid ligase II
MMPFPSVKQDPVKYWESHAQLFERIGAGAIVTYSENTKLLQDRLRDQHLHVLVPEDVAQKSDVFESAQVRLEDVAFIQHSSGTTGLKKGVQLSYGAVARQISSYAAALGLTSSDCIATWLPLYHDMGLIACFIMPLSLGLPVVSLDAFEWITEPEILFDAVQTYQCTHVWLPNFAFHHLCRTLGSERRYSLESVKAFVDCSESCRAETFDLFQQTFASSGVARSRLHCCYAMAETVFAVTQTALGSDVREYTVDASALASEHRATPAVYGKPSRRILSVGRVIAGLEIDIVDAQGDPLPGGHVGEIVVRGEFLFSGYYKNDTDTARSFLRGWYKTGDTGFVHDDELYILGRLKERIIVYGKNLYATDLEYICNRAGGVKRGRCVVFSVFNSDLGSEEIVVVAETEIPVGPEWTTIRRNIKAELLAAVGIPPHDVRIVAPGWLIKSTSGKIARGENLSKYLAETAPRNRRSDFL